VPVRRLEVAEDVLHAPDRDGDVRLPALYESWHCEFDIGPVCERQLNVAHLAAGVELADSVEELALRLDLRLAQLLLLALQQSDVLKRGAQRCVYGVRLNNGDGHKAPPLERVASALEVASSAPVSAPSRRRGSGQMAQTRPASFRAGVVVAGGL